MGRYFDDTLSAAATALNPNSDMRDRLLARLVHLIDDCDPEFMSDDEIEDAIDHLGRVLLATH